MFINIMILIIFDEVCFSMRNYFEDAEYRRDILFKWNNLILRSMMTSNKDKSVEEYLQLLIKQLRHLQHDLNSKFRSKKFIHNKFINACQNVFVCQYVCFKLSDSLIELINDLRSLIITYQKANSIIETFETFFIDRRYHKNFSSRINQNRRYLSKKKRFVCQKEECWSTKHSKDERETTKQKFKNCLNRFFIRIDHYISEYERTNLSSSYSEDDSDTDLIDEMKALIVNLSTLLLIPDNFSNVETFITSFDLIDNAEIMIINLVYRSFNHFWSMIFIFVWMIIKHWTIFKQIWRHSRNLISFKSIWMFSLTFISVWRTLSWRTSISSHIWSLIATHSKCFMT
jgi:hypothetical protein